MKRIHAYGPPLKAGLRAFVRTKKAGVDASMPWGMDFLKRLETFATTGKLLRGSVLCFSYEAFSGRPPDKKVLDLAMALELAHSGLLIHDDVMDDDDLRRGQPSMHNQYRSAGRQRQLTDTRRFGVNMALSGGDAAFFMAFELLGQAEAENRTLFVDQLLKTGFGQMEDIYLGTVTDLPPKRAIYDLMKTKTAAYTLALPLTMGAAAAGQPPSVLRRLKAIGLAGGTIFQIRDDELGIMGDSAQTGKLIGSDIKEGKKTLPYYYLFKNCDVEEHRKLQTIFGNPAISKEDIVYVQRLFKSHGVSLVLDKDVRRFEKKALADIDRLELEAHLKAELVRLIRFCAARSS